MQDIGKLDQKVDAHFAAFQHLVQFGGADARRLREKLKRAGQGFTELLAQFFRGYLALGDHLLESQQGAVVLVRAEAESG